MFTASCRSASSAITAAPFVVVAMMMQLGLVQAQVYRYCTSATNTFTVKVNLYASELGYFMFEECGDVVNPTIALRVGETYTFVQDDRSNYMHPLGFAYYPDGAHNDGAELEPGVSESGNTCAETLTCPAPMYHAEGKPLGSYSNLPGEQTTNETNFGLDDYELRFMQPIGEWASYSGHSIQLRFDDVYYNKDLFYFCHVHEFMSGRIKLVRDDYLVKPTDQPPLGYEYDKPGSFDQVCGTYNLDAMQLPNAMCPDQFVCGTENVQDPDLKQFATCIDAMNCHMMSGMTTGISSNSDIGLFVHQMVPHHQNAVNMAKAWLKLGTYSCSDLTDDEDPYCVMEGIMREIVTSQNHQIQQMYGVLEKLNLPEFDDCVVIIKQEEDVTTTSAVQQVASDGFQTAMPSMAWLLGISICALFL